MSSVRDRVYYQTFFKGLFYPLSLAFERMVEVFCTDADKNNIFDFKYSRLRIHDNKNQTAPQLYQSAMLWMVIGMYNLSN